MSPTEPAGAAHDALSTTQLMCFSLVVRYHGAVYYVVACAGPDFALASSTECTTLAEGNVMRACIHGSFFGCSMISPCSCEIAASRQTRKTGSHLFT
jgi:hypothetical protein